MKASFPKLFFYRFRGECNKRNFFEGFEDIESMPHSEGNQLTSYHVKQLIGVIQEAYNDDPQKCIRIAHLEIIFMNLLDWKNMKCFHHIIKQSPELFAQLVEGVFKKDHGTEENPQRSVPLTKDFGSELNDREIWR